MFDSTSLYVSYQTEILPENIDIMGHTNVRYYSEFFDKATRSFFNSYGLSIEYVRQSNMGSFALEQHIRYYSELREGQALTIYSRALGRSGKTFHFMHFMVRDEDRTLAATSEMVSVFADLTKRRAAPYPPEMASGIDKLLAVHTKLNWDAPVCGVMGVRQR